MPALYIKAETSLHHSVLTYQQEETQQIRDGVTSIKTPVSYIKAKISSHQPVTFQQQEEPQHSQDKRSVLRLPHYQETDDTYIKLCSYSHSNIKHRRVTGKSPLVTGIPQQTGKELSALYIKVDTSPLHSVSNYQQEEPPQIHGRDTTHSINSGKNNSFPEFSNLRYILFFQTNYTALTVNLNEQKYTLINKDNFYKNKNLYACITIMWKTDTSLFKDILQGQHFSTMSLKLKLNKKGEAASTCY